MFNIRKRLGASILLTILSIVSIYLLLPDSKVKQLQKITLGTTIQYPDLWKWGSDEEVVDEEEEDNGNGIRLVIFGDSWVDDWNEGHAGKGNNWPQVLCDEIKCTSRLNFASSQPSDAWPASPPTGVMTSNEIHAWAVSQYQFLRGEEYNYTAYPDLATQIQSYISIPAPKTQPQETIFILSFGFWDIYDFAQLDFPAAQNVTDTSIDFLFDQLDVLYTHFVTNLYPPVAETPNSTHSAPKFKVVIPRILDPTLLPGWISQRPIPAKPSSVAEQQKNAVYLAERWNQGVENNMGAWMKRNVSIPANNVDSLASSSATIEPTPSAEVRGNTTEGKTGSGNFEQFGGEEAQEAKKAGSTEQENPEAIEPPTKEDTIILPKKDIFYHDTASLLIDLILEHQLEDEGLSDASGLGKGDSPFDTITIPCLRILDLEEDPTEIVEGWRESNGMLVCKEPDMFMWWDAWNVGGKGKKMIGEAVGELFREGKSLRAEMEDREKGLVGHV